MIAKPTCIPSRHAALLLAAVCGLTVSCASARAELILTGSEKQPVGHLRTFKHNGDKTRTALIIFPTGDQVDADRVYPVVFWLHGTTSNVRGSDQYFDQLYNGEVGQKFVAVIPHGSPLVLRESGEEAPAEKYAWNHAPINGTSDLPGNGVYNYDDIGFLQDLCQRLYKDPRIQNGKGFYFMGHSAGGFMSLRMAMVCEATQGLSPSGASFHVPSFLTTNHSLRDVLVEGPVPYTHSTGYPDGTEYGGLLLRAKKRYPFNLKEGCKVRYVHINGGCDKKALWDGNLPPGNGTLPKACIANDVEASGMPLFPILKTADEWTIWNGGQAGNWNVQDGVINNDNGSSMPFRRYFKPVSGSTNADNIWVLRLKGQPHAWAPSPALNRLRVSLLLGQGWKY